jgi:hypothetical protein
MGMVDEEYVIRDGQFWYRDFPLGDNVGIIYEHGEVYDGVLKHGRADKVRKLFLSDLYSRLAKAGMALRMIEVPPKEEYLELTNKCIKVTAKRWCTQLEKMVKV